MEIKQNQRGFKFIEYPQYLNGENKFLIGESSVIRDYKDSFKKPGSSCLWIGNDHHLNREEVQELINHLKYWLKNKTLKK